MLHDALPIYCSIYEENNVIVKNMVDEILLYETQKKSAPKEAAKFSESDYDKNGLYQVDNMSLEETTKNRMT